MSRTVRSNRLTGRHLRGAVGVLLAVTLTACGGSDDQPADADAPSAAPTATATASAPDDELTILALDTRATAAERPAWMFPVSVDGWEVGRLNEGGVNQLIRGTGSAFTTYQIDRDPEADTEDDEAASRAFLERYLVKVTASDKVTDVTEPVYATSTVETRDGLQQVELVQQDVSYTSTTGTTYRSRYLARALDDTLMAVQYDEPEDSWSEQEWERLTETLSIDVTLTSVDG